MNKQDKTELGAKLLVIGALELLFILMYILMIKVNFVVGTVMIFIYIALLVNTLIQGVSEQARLEIEIVYLEKELEELKRYGY